MSNKIISRDYALKLRNAGKADFVSYVKIEGIDDTAFVNLNRLDIHATQCFKTTRLLADTTLMINN